MMHESDSTSDSHQSISLLSEAVVKQVQLSDSGAVPSQGGSPLVANLPNPSALPQLSSSMTPVPMSQLLPSSLTQPLPNLTSPSLVPQGITSGNPGMPINAPPAAPTLLTSAKPGPPPRTGFQPVPHAVQSFEAHHSLGGQQEVPPAAMPVQPGVSIFTPAHDPNAAPSPYTMPPQPPANQYQPAQHPLTGGNTSVNVSLDASADASSYFQQHAGQEVGIIDWLKTNETVNKVMQKAKTGVQTVITAMDPQMRDVLYSGGDIDIVVASVKDVKVEPVKRAFQDVFGRATVIGLDSQPGIAPQPVGFTSGIKGAEERISNLRRMGQVKAHQVCVAIESFIIEIQPEMWCDIACLMLNDPSRNITLQTFSQATPVNIEYVHQAQMETSADYGLAWSGLSVTVGQMMHRRCAVDPSDWHFYFTGVSRRETLNLAAKQLAYIYKQRLPPR